MPDIAAFPRASFADALKLADFVAASRLATEFCSPMNVGIVPDAELPTSVALWEALSQTECRIRISRATAASGSALRLAVSLPLIASYHAAEGFHPGATNFSLDDAGVVPGLAFCGDTPDYILVPDAAFLDTVGYRDARAAYEQRSVEWQARQRVAFWRGATTGRLPTTGWRGLQRTRLCQVAAEQPRLFDVGFSNVVQLDATQAAEVAASGLMREYVPPAELTNYRYHIDVDGNSNSWPGLFHKLLTGSPVLKVGSPRGFREWYYERLIPWRNFVPVSSGMDDLVAKVVWLMHNDDKAREIGNLGRELALSMTYEEEVKSAVPVIAAAMQVGIARIMPPTIGPQIMLRLHGEDIYEGFEPAMAEDLQGWNSEHPIFVDAISELRPSVVVDVGVWKGASTFALYNVLRSLGIDGVVVAVDTFLGSPEHSIRETPLFNTVVRRHGRPLLYEQFLSNVVRRRAQPYIVPLAQTSANAAMVLSQLGIRAGVIHIDAAHEHTAVFQDALAYWGLLTPGGYLIGDDYHPSWPGVIRGADDFAKSIGAELCVAPPKWFIRKPI